MTIASTNPTTGETLKTFSPDSDGVIEEKLRKAAAAAKQWRKTSFAERAQRMSRAAVLLEQRKDALARLMTLEMGKLRKAGVAEIEKCATGCRYYVENAERHLAPEPVQTDARRSEKRFQPLGPVLAIMPWNFPFWQVFRFAAPALMAGNVGLLKHASNVPQCALAIEEIFREAGFPDGCFQTLLTGSDAAGRSLASIAGAQVKKTVLELGGSDPFLILPSCDLDKAVQVAVAARVQNAGQSCIAAKRFIVHEKIAPEFEKRFVEKMRGLRVGDPQDDATEVGPLASRQVQEDVEAGQVFINGMVKSDPRLPFGGIKASGYGREISKEGIREFVNVKTVWIG